MSIPATSSSIASPSPITIVNATVGTNGFYTDYPRKPKETFFNSPDRIGLIVGCVLGTLMFIFLLVAAYITLRLRQKKRLEKLIDVDEYHDWNSAEKYQHSKLSHEYIHQQNTGAHVNNNFSLLDPHSAFSLAVQKASEIPDSPTSPK